MKKNGFTLIEILISLAIIAAIAGISIPAIYSNVMKIEQASTVESAMNGLRQFFVDARARSVKNEEAFELIVDDTSYEDLEFLEFKGKRYEDSLYYRLPSGIRTNLTMDITSNDTAPDGTFTYLLGLFLKEGTDYYITETDFRLYVKLEDTTVGTLTIDKGLPVLELKYE